MDRLRVAGYVKLAKLWEKRKEEAVAYHQDYYAAMFDGSEVFELAGVYIDITGNRDISRRPAMVRLVRDCLNGEIDCIVAQTRAYLAANMRDFSYLFKYLMDERNGMIDFITEEEDFHIDTLSNPDDQKEALYEMVRKFTGMFPDEYKLWKEKLEQAVEKINMEGDDQNG